MYLLITAIYEHGDDIMATKLYEVFYELGCMKDYTIFDYTINRLAVTERYLFSIVASNERKVQQKRSHSTPAKNVEYYERFEAINKDNNLSIFRQRTFRDKMEINILDDHITFDTEESCMECQRNINIEVV